MSPHHGRPRGSRHRRGAALLEALLGAVLGAVLLGATFDTMVRLTRVSHDQDGRAAARAQLEQGAGTVAADLRATTTTAATAEDPADLTVVSDTAIELAATVGGGVACAATTASGTTVLELAAAADVTTEATLAWWLMPARVGDLAFVHDDAGTATRTDDRWIVRTVRDASDGTTYCRSGAFAALAAASNRAGAARLRLTLDGPALPPSVGAGAPIRIARRRRYSLYRATDGWQLGVRDWNGSAWDTVQPIAGPFQRPADRGLQLTAIDAAGAPVQGSPPPRPVVEIRLLLRAPCAARDPRLRCVDSTIAVVRPRGNS